MASNIEQLHLPEINFEKMSPQEIANLSEAMRLMVDKQNEIIRVVNAIP